MLQNKFNKQYVLDKKKILREQDHLTRPPRMGRLVKNTKKQARKK